MSSTLLTLTNKILRRLGQQTVTTVASPSTNLQQIIDEINDTIQVDARSYDWNWMYVSGNQASTSGSRTLVLSSITNLDFLRRPRRVFEQTTPMTLKFAGQLEWERLTQTTFTGVPRRFRIAGTTSGSTEYLILELDPRPSGSISYIVEGFKNPTALSANGDSSPFPDEVIVNGVLMRHYDYDGNDYRLAVRLHDQALDSLMSQNDDSDVVFGDEQAISASSTAPPILPRNYGGF